MRQRIIYWFFCLTMFVTWTSCIDEIQFPVNSAERKLVIQGQWTDSLSEQTVTVARSALFGAEGDVVQEFIPGAVVEVIDTDGNSVLFQEGEPGYYHATTKGEVGKSYFLRVTTPDGNQYISTTHKMIEGSAIDTLATGITTEEYLNSDNNIATKDKVSLFIRTSLYFNEEPTYALFRIKGEFEVQEFYPRIFNIHTCFVTEDIDFGNIKVFSGKNLHDGLISEELLNVDFNWRFFINYCFHVSQLTIDQETYEYWKKVGQLSQFNTGLFDPPPGKIKGNIRNMTDETEEVYGFFTVGSVKSKKEFTNIGKLDAFVYPLCQNPYSLTLSRFCYDCLDFGNSTYTKPDYWP